jgi:hypothetical protein
MPFVLKGVQSFFTPDFYVLHKQLYASNKERKTGEYSPESLWFGVTLCFNSSTSHCIPSADEDKCLQSSNPFFVLQHYFSD